MQFIFTLLTTLFMFVCFLGAGVGFWLCWFCIPMFLYISLVLSEFLFYKEESAYHLPDKIPPEKKTACVIYTSLDELSRSVDTAEDIFLRNRDDNLCMILLCDPGESGEYWSLRDEERCMDAARRLNGRFYIYVPKREYVPKKKIYTGQGFDASVYDLIKYIKNTEGRYSFVCADSHFIHRVKYLITLDTTCEVESGCVPRLVGYMTFEGNRPRVADGTVASGYGLLSQTSRQYNGYGVINADVYNLLISKPDLASVNEKLKVLDIRHDYITRSKLDVKITSLRRDVEALKNIFQQG